jgi:hypothetical protein
LGQGKYLAHEALEEMCLVVELTANPKHIDWGSVLVKSVLVH